MLILGLKNAKNSPDFAGGRFIARSNTSIPAGYSLMPNRVDINPY